MWFGKDTKSLREKFTFMVVPHHSGKPFNLALSLTSLSLIATILLATFIWAGLSIYYFMDYQKVLLTNRRLTSKVKDFAQEMESIRRRVVEVEEVDQRLRELLNLRVDEAVVRYPGSGGPTSFDLKQVAAILREDNNLITQRFKKDVDIVEEDIEKRKESFNEIDSFIRRQKEIWQATPSIWPTSGWISCKFGSKKEGGFHYGIDISNARGTRVRATADGKVVLAYRSGGYGFLVVIDHGNGFRTRYAHNHKILVKNGDKVKKGQVIAYMGSSGKSTGTHLHYEVRMVGKAVNPLNYM